MLDLAVGKNFTFSGEVEQRDFGTPISYEGEIMLVNVSLWHDGTHPRVADAEYDCWLKFDGFDEDVKFAVRSVGDDKTAFTVEVIDNAHDVGIDILGKSVAEAIVDVLQKM